MKKAVILSILLPLFSVAQDYDYSPAINRNLEILFDNYLIDYNRMINIDPSLSPVDTIGIIEVLRAGNGHFLNGRETYNDTLRTNWVCSSSGNINTVNIQNLAINATYQRELIHFDASGRDTLIEVLFDTIGTGTFVKVQDLKMFYNNFGLDSVAIIDGLGGVGNEVFYSFNRSATGRLESLVAAIYFAGANYPIQTLLYYENNNGSLDSINLKNNLTGEVEEQLRPTIDANGKVIEFSIYERDFNNEWEIYDTYILSTETFFNLVENSKAFNFSLFPNPANDQIRVDLNEKAAYSIYHLSGTLMQEGDLDPNQSISLEKLNKGVYVIMLELADGSRSAQRFVKN